jgi:hypothetical protein
MYCSSSFFAYASDVQNRLHVGHSNAHYLFAQSCGLGHIVCLLHGRALFFLAHGLQILGKLPHANGVFALKHSSDILQTLLPPPPPCDCEPKKTWNAPE